MYPNKPWDNELWPTMCANFGATERGLELPHFLELYSGLSARDSQRDLPTQLAHTNDGDDWFWRKVVVWCMVVTIAVVVVVVDTVFQ